MPMSHFRVPPRSGATWLLIAIAFAAALALPAVASVAAVDVASLPAAAARAATPPAAAAAAATPPAATPAFTRAADVEAFVREGCPHCAKAEIFLAALGRERPQLVISVRDVGKDPAALARLKEIAKAQGSGSVRVPAVYAGGQLIVGYSPEANTDRLIRDALASKPVAAPAHTGADGACEAEESLSCAAGPEAQPAPDASGFEVTLFGRTISLDDVGLPLFTVAMGLLDGLNPCSMWVLILMISLLAPLNDRKRMVAIAGTFVLVEGIAYFAFMAAWLNLFLFIGLSRASELVIAGLAIVAGLINLKDVVAFGRGISLSIPDSAKPGIYARMRSILHAENLTAALVGTVILGLLVQVVEFLCTSGFPALFTRILTLKQLDTLAYYGYLLLYIAAYMVDDIVVLTIGVVTLSKHRLQEKEGRVLKLLSGLAMVGLGMYLVFRS
jgi:glutaredoxin